MEILGIKLRYSIRMLVAYEALTGKTFEGGSVTAVFNLILSAIATAPDVMNGSHEMPTAEDLYDYLDANPDTLERFAEWVSKSGRVDELLTGAEENGKEKKSSPSRRPSKS